MDRKVFTRATHLEQNHVHILKNGQVHFSHSPPWQDRLYHLFPIKYNIDTSLKSSSLDLHVWTMNKTNT